MIGLCSIGLPKRTCCCTRATYCSYDAGPRGWALSHTLPHAAHAGNVGPRRPASSRSVPHFRNRPSLPGLNRRKVVALPSVATRPSKPRPVPLAGLVVVAAWLVGERLSQAGETVT